jgi:hypothetical protein
MQKETSLIRARQLVYHKMELFLMSKDCHVHAREDTHARSSLGQKFIGNHQPCQHVQGKGWKSVLDVLLDGAER